MKNKQALWFVGLVLALVFSMTTTAMAENIRIGVASPFTGNLAAYGDNIKAGVNLKLKEINDAGGINGQKVELVWGDDLCQPKDAGTVGSKFAADKSIVAVIGHLCSSATLAAMPIYVRAELPTISPTSTNPTIGDVGMGWFFRNCYTDDFQGKYLAVHVVPNLLRKNKVAIFYENNDYAIGLKDSFITGAKSAGVKVTGAEAYVAKTTDFTPQLTKLLQDKPDTIFLCGYHPEGALIAKVDPKGPAAASGLHDGDVILSFDGKPVEELRDLPRLVAGATPGSDAKVRVWRDGAEKSLTVEIGKMPGEEPRMAAHQPAEASDRVLGLGLAKLTESERARLGLEEDVTGVLVMDVANDSKAAQQGIHAGDVIRKIDGLTVDSPSDVAEAVAKAEKAKRDAVVLLVSRGDDQRFVALSLAMA